jgi:hypothetical protein
MKLKHLILAVMVFIVMGTSLPYSLDPKRTATSSVRMRLKTRTILLTIRAQTIMFSFRVRKFSLLTSPQARVRARAFLLKFPKKKDDDVFIQRNKK